MRMRLRTNRLRGKMMYRNLFTLVKRCLYCGTSSAFMRTMRGDCDIINVFTITIPDCTWWYTFGKWIRVHQIFQSTNKRPVGLDVLLDNTVRSSKHMVLYMYDNQMYEITQSHPIYFILVSENPNLIQFRSKASCFRVNGKFETRATVTKWPQNYLKN